MSDSEQQEEYEESCVNKNHLGGSSDEEGHDEDDGFEIVEESASSETVSFGSDIHSLPKTSANLPIQPRRRNINAKKKKNNAFPPGCDVNDWYQGDHPLQPLGQFDVSTVGFPLFQKPDDENEIN